MILITKTFSETTPESARDGENSDSGFVWENELVSFRELVDLMRDHSEASCWPADGSIREWYSTGYSIDCYATMTEREESVHFSQDNKPIKAKYWRKAAIAAGIVKQKG